MNVFEFDGVAVIVIRGRFIVRVGMGMMCFGIGAIGAVERHEKLAPRIKRCHQHADGGQHERIGADAAA